MRSVYAATDPTHARIRYGLAVALLLLLEVVVLRATLGSAALALVVLLNAGLAWALAWALHYEVVVDTAKGTLSARGLLTARTVPLSSVTEIGRLFGRSGGPGIIRHSGGSLLVEIGMLGTPAFDSLTATLCSIDPNIRNKVTAHPAPPPLAARLVPKRLHPRFDQHPG